jgi:hypothetical protein
MQTRPFNKNTFIFWLCFLISEQNFSQEEVIPDAFPFPTFEKITARQGLSDTEVYKLTRDEMGFLWFLTYNGLNRYDGYSFKNYDYNLHDSNSITAGYFLFCCPNHSHLRDATEYFFYRRIK